MRIGLYIECLKFINTTEEKWCNKPDLLYKIVDILNTHQYFEGYHYLKFNDKYNKINNYRDITDVIKKLKNGSFFEYYKEKNNDDDIIFISITDDGKLGIDFFYEKEIIDFIKLFDQFERLVIDLYESLKDVFLIGPTIDVVLIDYDFLRKRPIRNFRFLNGTALMNIISKNYFDKNERLQLNGMNKLYNGELPEGVIRKVYNDDLYIIKWFDKIENETDIKECLMKREDWIYENLQLEPTAHFTEEGDKLILTGLGPAGEKDSFFTFYVPNYKGALKAVVLNKDNYIDPEIEEKIKYYYEKKVLENGDPIDRIFLIVPGREYAIAIRDKVKSIGVHNVYYTDNNGLLWNPFPAGEWRT